MKDFDCSMRASRSFCYKIWPKNGDLALPHATTYDAAAVWAPHTRHSINKLLAGINTKTYYSFCNEKLSPD